MLSFVTAVELTAIAKSAKKNAGIFPQMSQKNEDLGKDVRKNVDISQFTGRIALIIFGLYL